MAEAWINAQYEAIAFGRSMTLAITLKESGTLIGAIGLSINRANHWAEMGYWIGKPYWGQGYATEAAKALVAYGFKELDLNRIQARHMTENPASGRVMQKIGMTYEGTHRQVLYRFDTYFDLAIYSILRSEYHDQNDSKSAG